MNHGLQSDLNQRKYSFLKKGQLIAQFEGQNGKISLLLIVRYCMFGSSHKTFVVLRGLLCHLNRRRNLIFRLRLCLRWARL